MRALQVTGPGKCRIVEIDPPRCGADEVLIQVKDWNAELRQRAKEVASMKELGLRAAQFDPGQDTAADEPGGAQEGE